MNIAGAAIAVVPEPCTSEVASGAKPADKNSAAIFAAMLAQAGPEAAPRPITGGKSGTSHKQARTDKKQAAETEKKDAPTLLFCLYSQAVAAPEEKLPLTLTPSLTGQPAAEETSQTAQGAAEAPAVEAPKLQPAEPQVAFTADIADRSQAAVEPAAAPSPVSQQQAPPTPPSTNVKSATLPETAPASGKHAEAPKETEKTAQAEPVRQVEAAQPAAHATVQATEPVRTEAVEQPRRTEAPSAAEAVRASEAIAETGAPRVKPAAQVQEIKIRVDGENQTSAEVRVVARGGEVHVAVRTADAKLTESLRSDLGELVSKLGAKGLETRVWHPASVQAASQSTETAPQSFEHPSEQRRPPQQNRQSRDRRRRNAQPQDFQQQIEAIA